MKNERSISPKKCIQLFLSLAGLWSEFSVPHCSEPEPELTSGGAGAPFASLYFPPSSDLCNFQTRHLSSIITQHNIQYNTEKAR